VPERQIQIIEYLGLPARGERGGELRFSGPKSTDGIFLPVS
jgi:hypothetical protein